MQPIAKKLVTNEAMQPIAIQIDYADWLKIEPLLYPHRESITTVQRNKAPIEPNAWLGCMSDTGKILGDIVSPLEDNLSSWEVLAK
ncbi:hypothetical protein BGP_4154 [Beggiatoa sp. PS]|nr:hypothetical protein BGP_4154 [Beggiatoa sp. PS]